MYVHTTKNMHENRPDQSFFFKYVLVCILCLHYNNKATCYSAKHMRKTNCLLLKLYNSSLYSSLILPMIHLMKNQNIIQVVKDIYKVMSIKERFFSTMDGIDDCVTSWKGNSQVKTRQRGKYSRYTFFVKSQHS